MTYSAKDEVVAILAGYVTTHPDLEMVLTDVEAWRKAAEVELAARNLGIVKAMSVEALHAIANGDIDMPALYAEARETRGSP
ncbi:TPA: hypothetical protein ACK3Q6_003779 [Burkholderia cepacia]|uniref:Uncharacterized protein n=2 Tax=Burkholderia cepacia complex TaxID=87882 RepID=A0A250LLF4_9BURK|nr:MULTISPECIES: hypothetical protein [Burkholderia]HDV6371588.1 hypothetical protein [Burkholderia cepacia]MBA9833741.1 hypothetical protein [Burkholderia contaminans]MBA9909637.1 hypothetical protein [Burkholderia contaminans]MBR8292482.1 hypothetical protein [Burkholderia cenocepacia]MBX3826527.1 hypothetical protein [Burkholderia contaminans]